MLKLFKRNDFEEIEDFVEDEEYEEAPQKNNFEEPQIIESFTQEELEEYKSRNEKKYRRYKRTINIVFSVILLIIVFVTIDVISVSKYNNGPFFAIKTNTYKDGGSKVYYGLGYKVIKYNQIQGRRDTEIGFWNLKYNTNPIDVKDIDLAIEFQQDYEKTSKKYYHKFIRLSSTIKKVDEKNNKLTLEYLDEDQKYTLQIICKMADKESNLGLLKDYDKANVIGSIYNFKIKTKNSSNKVYLNDCFATPDSGEIITIDE